MWQNTYKIVVAGDLEMLMFKVNSLVRYGFKPAGGIGVWTEDGEPVLVQAMFIDEPPMPLLDEEPSADAEG